LATPKPDVPGAAFSHWLVDGAASGSESNTLTVTMNAHKTVQAAFVRNFAVNSADDDSGSAEKVTLRYALTNAVEGSTINITLEGDKTITLKSVLPAITRSVTINGNGAMLTQSGFTASASSQLLYINSTSAVVKISRLHFKGGRATSYGGAIRNTGALTLESCIFNDNQTSLTSANGGAIYTTGNLTVLGCTFYKNKSGYRGGAIYRGGGNVTLTGNLFTGNTASSDANGNVVYGVVANITSGGYNVSDKAAGNGTTAGNNSGYAGNANSSDVFSVTDITFTTSEDPTTAPSSSSSELNTMSSLPEGFPATYFDGTERAASATAGAVKKKTE
jgi:predicted outer membrane repeat protein